METSVHSIEVVRHGVDTAQFSCVAFEVSDDGTEFDTVYTVQAPVCVCLTVPNSKQLPFCHFRIPSRILDKPVSARRHSVCRKNFAELQTASLAGQSQQRPVGHRTVFGQNLVGIKQDDWHSLVRFGHVILFHCGELDSI